MGGHGLSRQSQTQAIGPMTIVVDTLTSVVGVDKLVADHGEAGGLRGTHRSLAEDGASGVVLAVVLHVAVGADEAVQAVAGGDVVHQFAGTAVQAVVGTESRLAVLPHSVRRAPADRHSVLDLAETSVLAVLLSTEADLAPLPGEPFRTEAVGLGVDVQHTCSVVLALVPDASVSRELEGGRRDLADPREVVVGGVGESRLGLVLCQREQRERYSVCVN